MRNQRALTLLATAVLLAGCGSSPKTHYYTIAVVKQSAPPATTRRSPVQVAAVHLPPALDRREMVRQTGANSVDVSDQNRWDAALGGLLRRTLSEELADALPQGMVVLPDAPAPPQTAQLVISIVEFAPSPDGRVRLVGSWTLLRGSSPAVVLRRDFSLESAARVANASEQAAAMSALWGEAALQIATGLETAPR